jgi:hypothetical protein
MVDNFSTLLLCFHLVSSEFNTIGEGLKTNIAYKCKVFLVIFHSTSMTLSQSSSILRGFHMLVYDFKTTCLRLKYTCIYMLCLLIFMKCRTCHCFSLGLKSFNFTMNYPGLISMFPTMNMCNSMDGSFFFMHVRFSG